MKHIFSIFLTALLTTNLPAGTRTWDGSANNNWKNNSNWSGGNSPQSEDSAIFPATVSRNEVDLSSSSSAGSALDRAVNGLQFYANGSNSTNGSPHGTMDWYFKWGRLVPSGVIQWSSSANNDTLRLDASIHIVGGQFTHLWGATGKVSTLDFYGDFSGPGFLVLNPYGDDDVVDLHTPQSLTGIFEVDGGVLKFSPGGSLPAATVQVETVLAEVDMELANNTNAAIGHLIGGPVDLNIAIPGSSSLTVGAKNLNGTFDSIFSGTPDHPDDFGLIKNGTGTWTLSGDHTFSHRTQINNGAIALKLGGGMKNSAVQVETNGTLTTNAADNIIGAMSGTGTVNINNTLELDGTNFLTPVFSGTLNGSGTLIQDSGATFTLSGSSGNFSGEVIINEGEIEPGATRLANSLVTLNADNVLDLQGDTTLGQLGGSGALTLDHNLTFGGNDSDCNYTGVFNGAGTLTKTGTGTWFYNNTTDTTGTINIDNGQLGGTGTLSAKVNINSNGAINPGISFGALNFAGNLDIDGTLTIEIDHNSHDTINVTGNLDPRTSTLDLSEINLGIQNTTYVIASYGSRNGTFANVIGLPFGYEVIYDYDDGVSTNNIAIVETHIPALEKIRVFQSSPDAFFAVRFDYPVENLDAADFQVVTTGLTGTPVISINGTGPEYFVTVTGLVPDGSSAEGTVSLQFANGASMSNRLGDPVVVTSGQSIIPIADATFTAGAKEFSRSWNAEGADVLIILALGYDQWDTNFNGSATATFGGQAMTRAVKEFYEVGPGSEFGGNAAIFYLLNPPSGDQGLVVKMLGNIPDDSRKYWVKAIACTGIDENNPVTSTAAVGGQTDHALSLTNVPANSFSVWNAVYQYGISGQTQINGSWYGNHPGADLIVANQFPGAGNPGARRRAMSIRHSASETVTIDPDSGSTFQTGVTVAANFAPDTYRISFPTADTITPSTTGPTNGTGLSFAVTFSEDVANFDNFSDLSLTTTGTATATGATITGSGANYTVTLTGIDGDGTLALAVSNSSDVENLSGLPLATSVTSSAVNIDTTYPTVVITTSTPGPTNADSITYDLAFSEPISGFINHTDFYITGTTTATTDIATTQIVNSGDDQNFTLTLNNLSGDGFLQYRLRRNQISDAAGNLLAINQSTLLDPFSPSRTIDNTAPVLSLNGPASIVRVVGEIWTDPGANTDDASPVQIGGDTVLTSTPGVYNLTYDSTDAAGNSAVQITRTVTIISVYDDWATTHGLAGNDALPATDPEDDTKSNLEEFALDGDPNSTVQENKTATFVTSVAGVDHLAITLPVFTGATFSGTPSPSATINGIIYKIQGSSNLIDWTESVVEVTPAEAIGLPALSAGWEYRTFRIVQPFSGPDHGFLRASIELVN